jgi:hypothetical protein
MGMPGVVALLLACVLAGPAAGQGYRTWVLGGSAAGWQEGGRGIDPLVLGGNVYYPTLDTTNTPGDAVDFQHRAGWISPLRFDAETNIASRVLLPGASITAPNAVEEKKVVNAQLPGIVNGDHRTALERKPTRLVPLNPLGIWVILDFGVPLPVHRVRFYPRNTVSPLPGTTYHDDYLRGYEVWLNDTLTSVQRAPDVLISRQTRNEQPVIDLTFESRYARLVKLKSLSEVAWEVDELEVYADGYLEQASYLTDLLDLGDRATLGRVRWGEETVGRAIRSQTTVRVRTGTDDTPLVFYRNLLDSVGVFQGLTEVVEGSQWIGLARREKGRVEEDAVNWSPWKALENGGLVTAPGQRRFIQFGIELRGSRQDTRQVNQLSFEYLRPPLADTLRAEVFPRLVQAEERATFRYAVLLRAGGPIQGYDRLAVDANSLVENIRGLTVAGQPASFTVTSTDAGGFVLDLPLIRQDSTVVEFTFDVPVFRFGTTFSGRAYNRRIGDLPQSLESGNAGTFGPSDLDELSGLSVAIPRSQVGRLVGEIAGSGTAFSPNGDGVNDRFELRFNLLQLTRPTPVVLEIYDLAGRQVGRAQEEERSIGPAVYRWDGRGDDGRTALPGTYLWVLQVEADAFTERHLGVVAVVY